MRNILLISEDYIKENSNLSDNFYGKNLLPAIREAQEMGLEPTVGKCLYAKLTNLVSNGEIVETEYADYKALLDDFVQPYLLYKVLGNIVPIANVKMANIGTVLTNDEHIVNLSQGESDLIQNYYTERSDFYLKRLQDHLKENKEIYPEVECGCKNNNLSSAASTNLWLGGKRNRIVRK